MDVFIYILISTFLISGISFVGALALVLKEKFLEKILLVLVAFFAGALIGGAFLHLLPEVIMEVGLKENQLVKIFLYLLSGFCFFFILEQFISWHHHHATRHPEIKHKESFKKSIIYFFVFLLGIILMLLLKVI